MTVVEFLDSLGIKLGVLVAGVAGGILRALSRQSYTVREMVASPICGALAAAYLTTPALHYLYKVGWGLPDDPVATMHATAFLTGASAMWISDLIIEAIGKRVRGGRTPGQGA